MDQSIRVVQDESHTVFFDNKRIGSIEKYFKDWSSFAQDSVGNIYGLGISYEDAVDTVRLK